MKRRLPSKLRVAGRGDLASTWRPMARLRFLRSFLVVGAWLLALAMGALTVLTAHARGASRPWVGLLLTLGIALWLTGAVWPMGVPASARGRATQGGTLLSMAPWRRLHATGVVPLTLLVCIWVPGDSWKAALPLGLAWVVVFWCGSGQRIVYSDERITSISILRREVVLHWSEVADVRVSWPHVVLASVGGRSKLGVNLAAWDGAAEFAATLLRRVPMLLDASGRKQLAGVADEAGAAV